MIEARQLFESCATYGVLNTSDDLSFSVYNSSGDETGAHSFQWVGRRVKPALRSSHFIFTRFYRSIVDLWSSRLPTISDQYLHLQPSLHRWLPFLSVSPSIQQDKSTRGMAQPIVCGTGEKIGSDQLCSWSQQQVGSLTASTTRVSSIYMMSL